MATTTKDKSPSPAAEKASFWQWLTEDDSPEIGIATKESLPEYVEGVKSEFKRIEWPSKEHAQKEFVAVLVIVAAIATMIFVIDLGLDNLVTFLGGAK